MEAVLGTATATPLSATVCFHDGPRRVRMHERCFVATHVSVLGLRNDAAPRSRRHVGVRLLQGRQVARLPRCAATALDEEDLKLEPAMVEGMEVAVKHLQERLGTISTGRAQPALLHRVTVKAYGSNAQLGRIASVTARDTTLLVVQPYDQALVGAVEEAISTSGLGLSCSRDGATIRVPIPPVTQERRAELVKHVKQLAEDCKKAIRIVRRDGMQAITLLQRDGAISKDRKRDLEEDVQSLTDAYVKQVGTLTEAKVADLTKI